MEEITLQTGRVAKMDQVRQYFDYLFAAQDDGDPFPVDFDTVWPIAYTTKANAKRALVESGQFYEGVDYVFIRNDENSESPKEGRPSERIVLSVSCFEYFIARKVRPVFDVYRECLAKIKEIAAGRLKPAAELPYHLRRYLANQDQVPFGYFSILQEITTRLIGQMEARGYTLPESMFPDISVGKIFCKWLREEMHLDPESFPVYQHSYEDGRVVSARAYPLYLLSPFAIHFHDVWLKEKAPTYFKGRDPKALECLTKILEGPKGSPKLDAPTAIA